MDAAKRKIRGRKLAVIQLVLLIAAIITIVLLANSLEENRVISEVVVNGNKALSYDEVFTKELKKLIDTSKGSDIIFNVSNQLKKSPFIADAFVSFQGSNKLLVEIKERRPAAMIIDATGYPGFICADGTLLPYSHLPEFINLPVIRLDKEGYTQSELYGIGALEILQCLTQPESEFIQQNISEVICNTRTKTYEMISSGFGIRIYFGTAIDACNKLKKLSVFWEHEMPGITPGRVKYVDVRWNNQVVVNFS